MRPVTFFSSLFSGYNLIILLLVLILIIYFFVDVKKIFFYIRAFVDRFGRYICVFYLTLILILFSLFLFFMGIMEMWVDDSLLDPIFLPYLFGSPVIYLLFIVYGWKEHSKNFYKLSGLTLLVIVPAISLFLLAVDMFEIMY